MKNNKKLLFLLGGYDLEMLEIKNILVKSETNFLDAKLKWGASWKDYQEEPFIEQIENARCIGKKIVGIELSDFPSENEQFLLIDHHNERQDGPSSIEQVAKLLNIELNHWQQLVAANDKGHMSGMNAMCASWEDKVKIRKEDRRAQGVTEIDDLKAKEDIAKKVTREDVIMVHTNLSHFSPIVDFLGEYRKLIIYTDSELVYYGANKPLLETHYSKLIEGGKAYHGGGSKGFFGLNNFSFNKDEILAYKDEIYGLVKQQKLHSHHVFMFPFKWRHWKGTDESTALDKLCNLKDFDKLIISNQWIRDEFKLTSENSEAILENYNEYNYFYAHVREVMYDLEENLTVSTSSNNKHLIRHYSYKLDEEKSLHYCIETPGNIIYRLQIDSILLNIYATGTAVLSFHLKNFYYQTKEDVFKINAFGRRLFPPFFGLGDDSVATGAWDQTTPEEGLKDTKNSELPNRIWIDTIESEFDQHEKLHEDFSQYHDPKKIKYDPFLIPAFVKGLFPDSFLLEHEQIDPDYLNYKIYIRPVIDDRMFVVCWHGNRDFIDGINAFDDSKKQYQYASDQDWYKYVFVDGCSAMCQNKLMLEKLNADHTYARWVEWGTLFGISRYSLVMLTGDFDETPSFLIRHLQTIYYKIAELCLVQRATILNFADEATHVSSLIEGKESTQEDLRDRVTGLYAKYLIYLNKIHFREITAQEQGMELYDLMQKHQRIDSEGKELDGDINELHNYISLESDKTNNRLLALVTLLGAMFLPLTLMIGVFGMNTMPDSDKIPENLISSTIHPPFWISLGLSFCITAILGLLFTLFKTIKGKNWLIWSIMTMTIGIIFILIGYFL